MSQTPDPLQTLYPFLHGAKKDAAHENAALLESVRHKAQHSQEVKQRFFEANAHALVDVAHALAEVYLRKGRMFTLFDKSEGRSL